MRTRAGIVLIGAALLALVSCRSNKANTTGGGSTLVPISSSPTASPASSSAPNQITVALGETDPQNMFIHTSGTSATAGKVTFVVTNEGTKTHEFVVLKTDTAASALPIVSFEGESDRIDEEATGVENVGETGDLEAGATFTLTIDLKEGHYALVCNLKGHYRMGMHQDFQVS
jgi:uncharacterized cupredoxin-like copper-binding protein